MRISSNLPPSYKPSYTAATLPPVHEQEPQPQQPAFAGRTTGTNWKKQIATTGLLALTAMVEQAQGASVPPRLERKSHTSTSTDTGVSHSPSNGPEIPGLNLDSLHLNLTEATHLAKAQELKTHDAKVAITKEELKRAELKKAEQHEADKRVEAQYWEQKNALQKRDGDASKVCKAPDGTVVITSWWSSTGSGVHG